MIVKRRGIYFSMAVSALIAGIVWGLYQHRPVSFDHLTATVISPPKKIAEFELVDHSKTPFTKAGFEDRWTFLFFGYTHCPDICPTTLATMAHAHRALLASGSQDQRVIFITVDPARDTVEKLSKYVPYFHESFVGVTGRKEDIERFAKQIGVVFFPQGEGDSYLVDHSSQLLLINPSAALRAVFSPPFDPNVIAKEFLEIKENS